MPWFKVDDQLDGNKKVRSIPRRNRTKAMGLWVLAGSMSARELTDGFVPDYMIEELASTPTIAKALVDAGLWEKVENGYLFVNWSEFQPTSDEVRSKREAARKRQSEWRSKKKQEPRNSPTSDYEEMSQRDNSVTNGVTKALLTPTSQDPDPTRPDPTNIKVGGEANGELGDRPNPTPKSLDELAAAHAASQTTRQRGTCATHPDGNPNDVPCHGCATARREREHDEAQAEEQRAKQRRAAIDACQWCDTNGMREIGDGNTLRLERCTHQPF